jgi:hypothetical protein
MKRLLAALTLALLVSFAVGASVAYADHGTDYARGTVEQGSFEWRFSASSNFNGTQPSGTIKITFRDDDPDTVVTADVTCLNVVNGVFNAGGQVTSVRGGTFAFSSVIIRGSDAGKFSTTPDTFGATFFFSSDPGPCPPPTPGSPVQNGEVIVHDS